MKAGAIHSARTRGLALLQANYGSLRGWWRSVSSNIALLMGLLDRYLQPSSPVVRRLVFVCLGNINRSAFAAATAIDRGSVAVSFGLAATTGASATSAAVRQARTFDIDLRRHVATDISEYDFTPGDLLVAMETRHARLLADRGIPISSICLLGYWAAPRRIHLQDPQTMPEIYFRTCFSLVHSAVDGLLEHLAAGGSPCITMSESAYTPPT